MGSNPRSRHRLRARLRAPRRRRLVGASVPALVSLSALAAPAAAHAGSMRATQEPLTVPTWLFLLTGGGVVGASFLLASFVTDRSFVAAIHAWRRSLPALGRVARFARIAARIASVSLLAATLYLGFFGPQTAMRNLAILVVWVGWWAGYTATTYLVGNTWPALNPFRAVAEALPSLDLPYPDRLGAWPSVVGLLALVWVEVVSPLADDPGLLATVVAGYTLCTVTGAVAFGSDRWFSTVDPVARLFGYYGRVAPLTRDDEGRIRVRLPGAALAESRLVTGRDEVAFVVAVLFATTYDGFVGTAPWSAFARASVGVGAPPTLVYLSTYLAGFGLFYAAYRWSARTGRRTAETYLTADVVARRFAPSLLAIAAGYHLAHYLGMLLTLSPTLVSVALSPLSPPLNPPQLAGLPDWFGGLELSFVLAGHLVAVWVAHATAYDLFPSRLQAVRGQYGVTVTMVAYTMTSLWIVSEPFVAPPYL